MTLTAKPPAAAPPGDESTGPDAASVSPRRPRNLRSWMRGGGLSTLVFLAPMLFVFTIFSWSPIVQSLIMSLQKTNLLDPPTWVGLDNFVHVLNDPLLGTAILNTVYFAALALLFGFPLPILVAVLMSEVRRAKGIYSALAYLPVVVPPVVAVLLWKVFYDASPTGLFNTILGWVGIPPQPWLQSSATAMPSLVLEATWAAAGGAIIIYLAALLSVPPELYDAAEVDGASRWQRLRHVTVPGLRSVIVFVITVTLLASANMFGQAYLTTQGAPAEKTRTAIMFIAEEGFQDFHLGSAAAMSYVLALFLMALSAGVFFFFRDREEAR